MLVLTKVWQWSFIPGSAQPSSALQKPKVTVSIGFRSLCLSGRVTVSNLKQGWFWEPSLCIHELWAYNPRTSTEILFNTKCQFILAAPFFGAANGHSAHSPTFKVQWCHMKTGTQGVRTPAWALLLWSSFSFAGASIGCFSSPRASSLCCPPDRCPHMNACCQAASVCNIPGSFQVQDFSPGNLVGGLQILIMQPIIDSQGTIPSWNFQENNIKYPGIPQPFIDP